MSGKRSSWSPVGSTSELPSRSESQPKQHGRSRGNTTAGDGKKNRSYSISKKSNSQSNSGLQSASSLNQTPSITTTPAAAGPSSSTSKISNRHTYSGVAKSNTNSMGLDEIPSFAHHFEWHTFYKMTYCGVCSKVLWGFSRQGLQCEVCQMDVHDVCQQQAPECLGAECVADIESDSDDELCEKVDLEFKLISCCNLAKKFFLHAPDPFVDLVADGKHYKSPIQKKTYHPQWDSSHVISVRMSSTIRINVYDNKRYKHGKNVGGFLGLVAIPVHTLLENDLVSGITQVQRLKKYKTTDVVTGRLVFAAKFANPGRDEQVAAHYIQQLHVARARQLANPMFSSNDELLANPEMQDLVDSLNADHFSSEDRISGPNHHLRKLSSQGPRVELKVNIGEKNGLSKSVPATPAKLTKIEVKSDTSLSIKWEPVENPLKEMSVARKAIVSNDDELLKALNAPVSDIKYVLQRNQGFDEKTKDTGVDSYETITEHSGVEIEHIAVALKTKFTYRFRVKAVNLCGSSEYSEWSDPVFVKVKEVPPTSTSSTKPKPVTVDERPHCPYYMSGYCAQGRKCKFSHGTGIMDEDDMAAAMIAAHINRDPNAEMAVAIAASLMESTTTPIDTTALSQTKRSYHLKINKFRNQLRMTKGECHLTVVRQSLFASSYAEIMHRTKKELKKKLFVHFKDEGGLDYGGLAREWFYLLSHELFTPARKLFEFSDHQSYLLQVANNANIEETEHNKNSAAAATTATSSATNTTAATNTPPQISPNVTPSISPSGSPPTSPSASSHKLSEEKTNSPSSSSIPSVPVATNATDTANTDATNTDTDTNNTETINTDPNITDTDTNNTDTDTNNTDTNYTDTNKTDADNTDTSNTDTNNTDTKNADTDTSNTDTDTNNTETNNTNTNNTDTTNFASNNTDTGSTTTIDDTNAPASSSTNTSTTMAPIPTITTGAASPTIVTKDNDNNATATPPASTSASTAVPISSKDDDDLAMATAEVTTTTIATATSTNVTASSDSSSGVKMNSSNSLTTGMEKLAISGRQDVVEIETPSSKGSLAVPSSTGNLELRSMKSSTDSRYYLFVGRILGLAVFHSHFVDAVFVNTFYKCLAGQQITLSDLEILDPSLHQSLLWLLENPGVEHLDMTFSVDANINGKLQTIDLIQNGADTPVNDENKEQFVELMLNWRVNRGTQSQVNALKSGFHEYIPESLLKNFSEQELEFLLSGESTIDVEDWKSNTVYKDFEETDDVVKWFWKVVSEGDQELMVKIVQFVTGTQRIPTEGFQALQGSDGPRKFCIQMIRDTSKLPASHTCFNRLDLPKYKSFEELKVKLVKAVMNFQGFSEE